MILEGATTGLKPLQIKRLNQIASRKIKSDRVITAELGLLLTVLSFEIGRQIGILVGREGTIHAVIIGNERGLVLPDITDLRFGKRALRGVRLIHTHLKNEPLNQDDLSDLALLRLDMIAAIGVRGDGTVGDVYLAHLLPPNPDEKLYEIHPPVSIHQLDFPLHVFLSDLESEFDANDRLRTADLRKERSILISASTRHKMDQEESLEELAELARSARLVPIDRVVQRLKAVNPRYLLGAGKLKEVIMKALQQQADILIFDQNLTPLQVKMIGETTEMKVLDRTQLILDIFAQRAKTREAKVQVELAQLRYRLPRLAERSTALSRLTGGIGGRGPGETRLSVDRSRTHDRITQLEHEIKGLIRARGQRRSQRIDRRIPIISIVGYTNAGKTTLLNTLTKSNMVAEDLLFATLDTATRRVRFPSEREMIVTDTVGFIQSLPDELLGAFQSTLDELKDAHLLIHLVDISHPRFECQIETVEKILRKLELNNIPRLYVFNKKDQVNPEMAETVCSRYDGIAVSAIDPTGMGNFFEKVETILGNKETDQEGFL